MLLHVAPHQTRSIQFLINKHVLLVDVCMQSRNIVVEKKERKFKIIDQKTLLSRAKKKQSFQFLQQFFTVIRIGEEMGVEYSNDLLASASNAHRNHIQKRSLNLP